MSSQEKKKLDEERAKFDEERDHERKKLHDHMKALVEVENKNEDLSKRERDTLLAAKDKYVVIVIFTSISELLIYASASTFDNQAS